MPYPGSTKTVGGPIGSAGKAQAVGPRTVFLPLSAFFLQMQGEMDGDGGETGITGFRRKKPGKGSRKAQKGRGSNNRASDGKSADQTRGGSGDDVDAIGKDSAAGAAPKGSVAEAKDKKKPLQCPHKCAYCKDQATKAYVWADHRAFIPVCDCHERMARRQIEIKNKDEVSAIKDLPQPKTEDEVQTSAQEAITTTANVPTTPIPLGPPLRRVTPTGRRKKKKPKQRRDEWAGRLVAMAGSTE